jgi:predicted transcriptional regulator
MPRRKTTVYLDDDLRLATKAVAATTDRSENDVIEEALRTYLESGRAAKARDSLRRLMKQWADQPTGLTDDEAMALANEGKQWARQRKRG